MIRNHWYVVLESEEVGRHPLGVARLGKKMVFGRDAANTVQAAVDRCPHYPSSSIAKSVLRCKI